MSKTCLQLKGISKELTALRAVLSWIEIYKLEDENFHEVLVKHIAEQEKQQAEKKREYDSSNVKNGPHTRSKDTLLQQHQQQQTNCSPKTLGSEMDPQQTNQVRPQHTEQKCVATTTMITATTAPSTPTSGNTLKSEPQEHSGIKRRRTEVPRDAPPIYAVGATSAFQFTLCNPLIGIHQVCLWIKMHHTSTHQLDIIVCQAILCLTYI